MDYLAYGDIYGLFMFAFGLIAIILVFILGWENYRDGRTIGFIGIGISLLISYAYTAFMWIASRFCV